MPQKPRILIVDDEALYAMLMERNLQMLGYPVCSSAGSGRAAVAMALSERPDVVIMDVSLSGSMDGLETAARIREVCDTEIIFVTGHEDDDLRSRADVLAPLAYLVKPITPDDLLPYLTRV